MTLFSSLSLVLFFFLFLFLLLSCGTFQNLREAVWDTQVLALTCLPRKKAFFVRRGTNYLIRYFMLILINAYMTQELEHDFKRLTFAEWLDARPEVSNILQGLQYPEEYRPASETPKPMNRRGPSSLLSPMGFNQMTPSPVAVTTTTPSSTTS